MDQLEPAVTINEPPGSLGTWLRREREKRCWSRTEMARRLIKAAENHGDATMPGIRDVSHCIYRWERDAVSPGERYRLFYCEALGITPDDFGVQTCETTSPPTIEVRGAVSIVITIDGDGTEISIAKLPADSS